MGKELKNQLLKALIDNQLKLSYEQINKLVAYAELIQLWNKVYNLTAITKPDDIIYLHLIDSLLVLNFLHGHNCLDIGSGAGLPGIPLAILDPEKHWTLIDKNSKKTRFLIQACAELGLKNVEVIHERSESFAPSSAFDSILSRALGTLEQFATLSMHLLAPGGRLIAMKGKVSQEELAHIPDRMMVKEVVKLAIEGRDIERHLVILQRKRN